MRRIDFVEGVERICRKDSRYDRPAYYFLREALDFTVKTLDKPRHGQGRHVAGQELLEGIRRYALREFGPMALTVLTTWGVKRTDDIGEIVFNLVDIGALGRTNEDKKEDFVDGYDFYEAFARPFLPETPVPEQNRTKGKSAKKRRVPEGQIGDS